MKKFRVVFYHDNGKTQLLLKSESLDQLIQHINEFRDGFYGDGSNFVNLRNVSNLDVFEQDDQGYDIVTEDQELSDYIFSLNSGFDD